jgi:hypothetical protein
MTKTLFALLMAGLMVPHITPAIGNDQHSWHELWPRGLV